MFSRQDEDLFQLARNVNVGFFATVLIKDYVDTISNTLRANTECSMEFTADFNVSGHRAERGTGNACSVEFAALYRWHAALSAVDDDWVAEVIHRNIPEIKSMDQMTGEQFWASVKMNGHRLMSMPAKEWTFAGLKRGKDGKFSDLDLC